MITSIRDWFHQRALARAEEDCKDIAHAGIAAAVCGDHAAARYFEAELKLAQAKRAALNGHPNPGRYCCDHKCERQGRENCACDSLPRPTSTPGAGPWYLQRHTVWRAILISTAVFWAGMFFFFTT